MRIWRGSGSGGAPGADLASSFPAGLLADMEDSLGLRILRVKHHGCLGAGCPPRGCRNAVRLTAEPPSRFSTARASYITPRHRWESVCPCNGEPPSAPCLRGTASGVAHGSRLTASCLALQRARWRLRAGPT